MINKENGTSNICDNYKNNDNIEEIEGYDGEIKEDDRLEILIRMIKNNRPIQHIIEDTGYTEKEIDEIKKIMELVKKACGGLENNYPNGAKR
ncbi:MAG: hypothetical protein FWD71_08020 [Oscillospiraceae bacterium]|nr:hypothetical protein [Oscillospiraceae bacterium]